MVERVGHVRPAQGQDPRNLSSDEPSTRTFLVLFTSAMERLGGSVIPINEVKYSSITKGRKPGRYSSHPRICYADVIVLRHPETGIGRRRRQGRPQTRDQLPVTAPASIPLRRCWTLHHPCKELGRLDQLNVTMLGDLKYGASGNSLAPLPDTLRQDRLRLDYVAPRHLADHAR